jgi:hypothetical protein
MSPKAKQLKKDAERRTESAELSRGAGITPAQQALTVKQDFGAGAIIINAKAIDVESIRRAMSTVGKGAAAKPRLRQRRGRRLPEVRFPEWQGVEVPDLPRFRKQTAKGGGRPAPTLTKPPTPEKRQRTPQEPSATAKGRRARQKTPEGPRDETLLERIKWGVREGLKKYREQEIEGPRIKREILRKVMRKLRALPSEIKRRFEKRKPRVEEYIEKKKKEIRTRWQEINDWFEGFKEKVTGKDKETSDGGGITDGSEGPPQPSGFEEKNKPIIDIGIGRDIPSEYCIGYLFGEAAKKDRDLILDGIIEWEQTNLTELDSDHFKPRNCPKGHNYAAPEFITKLEEFWVLIKREGWWDETIFTYKSAYRRVGTNPNGETCGWLDFFRGKNLKGHWMGRAIDMTYPRVVELLINIGKKEELGSWEERQDKFDEALRKVRLYRDGRLLKIEAGLDENAVPDANAGDECNHIAMEDGGPRPDFLDYMKK